MRIRTVRVTTPALLPEPMQHFGINAQVNGFLSLRKDKAGFCPINIDVCVRVGRDGPLQLVLGHRIDARQSVRSSRISPNFLLVIFPLISPRYSGGNDPPVFAAPSEDHGSYSAFTLAYGEKPLLAMLFLAGRTLVPAMPG